MDFEDRQSTVEPFNCDADIKKTSAQICNDLDGRSDSDLISEHPAPCAQTSQLLSGSSSLLSCIEDKPSEVNHRAGSHTKPFAW